MLIFLGRIGIEEEKVLILRRVTLSIHVKYSGMRCHDVFNLLSKVQQRKKKFVLNKYGKMLTVLESW